jgi:prephenate dehydrogenase
VSGAGAKADSESLLAESRVAVVGLGLMGGSLALALRGRCAALLGSDLDPAVVKAALRLHVVDRASTEPGDILPGASLVILAAPVRAILDLIRSLPKLHPGRAVVLDIGSTKAAIHRALAALPERLEAVGGHPMCGKETPGLHRAEATLYRGAKFALTACAGTTPAGRRLAEEVVGAVGAEALWLDPELHDAWTAATSHMPYLLSCGLALATPGEAAPLVGPGFRSTSRLALSDPTMMTDILATNRTAVLEALERFRGSLQTLTDRLSREDWDELGKVLEEASAARRRIEPATGTSD